jgi:hypothetical protein
MLLGLYLSHNVLELFAGLRHGFFGPLGDTVAGPNRSLD